MENNNGINIFGYSYDNKQNKYVVNEDQAKVVKTIYELYNKYYLTLDEIEETLVDLKNAGVDIVTIGQYIQPSKAHLPVEKYYTLEEFEDLRKLAHKVGITNHQIDPLVRSSYKAAISYQQANEF